MRQGGSNAFTPSFKGQGEQGKISGFYEIATILAIFFQPIIRPNSQLGLKKPSYVKNITYVLCDAPSFVGAANISIRRKYGYDKDFRGFDIIKGPMQGSWHMTCSRETPVKFTSS